MKKKNSFRNIIVGVVVFLCFCLASVFINRNFNLPDFFLKDGILFADRFITRPFETYSDSEYNRLMTENENLRKEIDSLKYYESENEELVNEINKLKELTKINKSLSDRSYVNASVVSRSVDYWTDSVIVDKGSSDEVSNNMAVVSGGYLVGITSNVSHFNSNVILLTNSKFPVNISVKIKVDDKYVYGILNKYDNGTYEVMGIVENIEIPSGSKVVTTGLGNIFPSGLLVGYVDSVETDNFDLSKVVRVKSGVDFNDIGYVTIVKRDD